jgi:hypothetical protein
MPAIHLENLSPFGRLAVKLDGDLMELVRLSGQIQRLEIETEGGLEHALTLLARFAQHGQILSAEIQDFARFLQEAQQQSESATKIVAERAQQIVQRREEHHRVREKLARVEQDVKAASENLTSHRKEGKKEFSEDDKRELVSALSQLQGQLEKLATNAESVKSEAADLKFKNLERNAQSLLDTLQASRRRIHEAINQ